MTSNPARQAHLPDREAPQVLIPFDRREALTLKQAADISGRSESTLRTWAALYSIGRRVGGGPWLISHPGLLMFLDADRKALEAYLSGNRETEQVASYFKRAGL